MSFHPIPALTLTVYSQGDADVILLNAANQFLFSRVQETPQALRPFKRINSTRVKSKRDIQLFDSVPQFKGKTSSHVVNCSNVNSVNGHSVNNVHCIKKHPRRIDFLNPKPFYNVPYLIKRSESNTPIKGKGEH